MSLQPIRRSVTVSCPPERAFRLFTEEIGSWWPVETHSRAVDDVGDEGLKVERVEFQARVGGQVPGDLADGAGPALQDLQHGSSGRIAERVERPGGGLLVVHDLP